MKSDLFEILRDAVGCSFISDLRFGIYNKLARRILADINLNQYSTEVLEDAANYIFGHSGKFSDKGEAIRFLKSDY